MIIPVQIAENGRTMCRKVIPAGAAAITDFFCKNTILNPLWLDGYYLLAPIAKQLLAQNC